MLRTDHTEQSLLVITVCSGMCLGVVHFFAKIFLGISQSGLCTEEDGEGVQSIHLAEQLKVIFAI